MNTMNTPTCKHPKRRTLGFTIIELMVGLAVGALVVLVVFQFMVSNKQTSRTQGDASRIQEGARFAFDRMSQHLRQAGFSAQRNGAVVQFANTAFQPVAGTSCATGVPALQHMICGNNDGGLNSSDELQIRYYGQSAPDNVTADGSVLDCAGNAVNGTTLVEERYRIANDPNGVPTLWCAVITGSAAIQTAAAPPAAPPATANNVALVSGVERMQILYGFDNSFSGQAGDNNITSIETWGPATPAANMERVLAIRVALLMRGDEYSGAAAVDTNTYRFFGPGYVNAGDAGATLTSPNDTRVRKLISFTTSLRDRL